ncbi:MAG: L-2-amino-thiazoline-4-carboxylic acid hydrolase [Propionibacteriaceae bacterium]|nr:L-2-amino-thiazoline-4-carboxylic acid hydrolase [Propionibacteriaceae bacterium]
MSEAAGRVSLIQRREIEAGVLGPVYDILVRDVGVERARAVVGEAVERDARAAGAAAGAGVPAADRLRRFVALQSAWREGGALEAEDTLVTDHAYEYTVRRCAYAELYARMGRADLGALLSCRRDAAFAEGYDPAMALDRPQTIMEGAPTCVFHYALPPDPS